LGIATLLFTTWDLFWTTLGEGGGPLTRQIARQTHRLTFTLHRAWPSSQMLGFGGIIVILMTVATWILLHWVGWTLIFSAAPEAVYSAADDAPAGIWQRVYFSGYVISTLGIGDMQPRGGIWRVLTALASISGLFQISFSIAYLVPLALAATFKRKVATSISCLGQTATDVILNMRGISANENAERNTDWSTLASYLRSLSHDLAHLNQQHLTYPVLHYFHSWKDTQAIGPSLARLDEALTIIEYGLVDGEGPRPGSFHAARRMISDFLQTLDTAFPDVDVSAPPPPTLCRLREAGVPVVSDAEFTVRVRELEERRRLLHALLYHDDWAWETVSVPAQAAEDAEADSEKQALAEVEAIR
jgi:hypothetical protein